MKIKFKPKTSGEGTRFKKPLPAILAAAVFLPFCHVLAEGGNRAFVFEAKGIGADGSGVVWQCLNDSGLALRSVHSLTNESGHGWSQAQKFGDALVFASGDSPLEFAGGGGRETNTFAYAAFVLEVPETAPLGTVLSVPGSPARFVDEPEDDIFTAEQFDGTRARVLSEELLGATNALSVNNAGFSPAAVPFVKPSRSKQLVEIILDEPAEFGNAFVFGNPVSQAWRRGMPDGSGVSEIVLLAEAPTDPERNSVIRLLAVKHGLQKTLARRTVPENDLINILKSLSIPSSYSSPYLASTILIR